MNKRAYIKLLTTAMYDVQAVRKAVDNRIGAFSKATDEETKGMAEELNAVIAKKLHDTEDSIADSIADHVKDVPIMQWLNNISGIGPRLSGSLIGMIGELPDTVSQLWTYCGQANIPVCETCKKTVIKKGKPVTIYRHAYQGDERIKFCRTQAHRRWETNQKKKDDALLPEKQEEFEDEAYKATENKLCQCETPGLRNVAPDLRYFEGLLLTFNPFLKMTCWKISGQFIIQGKFYRNIYDQAKAKYLADESLTKIHAENRARRYVVKLFLSHLHEMWSKSEGKEVKPFYYKEFGDFTGHTYIDPPYKDIFEGLKSRPREAQS